MDSSRGAEHSSKEVPTQQGGRGDLINPLGGNGEDTDCDCYKGDAVRVVLRVNYYQAIVRGLLKEKLG